MLSAFASVELETSLVAEVVMPFASAVVGQEMPTVVTRCLAVGASAEQPMAGPQLVCRFVAGQFYLGFADHCEQATPAAAGGFDSCFEQIQAESL